MPPFVAFAGALGGLAVVRWAYKTALKINKELEEARLARVAEAARSGDIPTLRRDPVTGAYRPGLEPAPPRAVLSRLGGGRGGGSRESRVERFPHPYASFDAT